MRTIKYKGNKYNKLLILSEPYGTGNNTKVKVKCDCGVVTVKGFYYVLSGCTTSCGHVRYTARKQSKINPLYSVYAGIRDRCNNIRNKDYIRYGGRGIKLEWNNFIEFEKDMGKKYLLHRKKHGINNTSIDRIDGNGNYCKENCKWATVKEQSSNRRTNKFLTVNGITKIYAEWARIVGCSRQALRYRVVNGLNPNLILTMPFKYSNRYDKTL